METHNPLRLGTLSIQFAFVNLEATPMITLNGAHPTEDLWIHPPVQLTSCTWSSQMHQNIVMCVQLYRASWSRKADANAWHTQPHWRTVVTQALSIHVASDPLKARTYYLAYSHHHTIPLSTLQSPQLELASSCVNYILGKQLDKTIPALVFIKSCTYPSRPCTLQVYVISYNTVTVPCGLLHINVCPIYKKGTRKVPVNYRPISLTCSAYKLFEHIVIYTSSLMRHLD